MLNSKKIALKSSNGQIFEIEETVALQSQFIASLVKNGCVDNVISLSKITSKTLTKVIEYCKKHNDGGGSKEELKIWDVEFMKNIDQSTIFNLIEAAKYLDIESLLDLSCQTAADMVASKNPDEIRSFFNLEKDYTPEEEAKNLEENKWAFE